MAFLQLKKLKIAASILSTDFTKINDTIAVLEEAGVDSLHIDVMDGHFVQNISVGHEFVAAVRRITKLPIDVHLMISNPERQIEKFAPLSDVLTVHYESTTHVDAILQKIRIMGTKPGIAIVPSTHYLDLEYVYDRVQSITVMSVNPGKSGQTFLENQIEKIKKIRHFIAQKYCYIDLAVDGGITEKNAYSIVNAGASTLVLGSALFNDDYDTIYDRVAVIRDICSSII